MAKSSRKSDWRRPPDDKTPIFLRSELDDYGLDVYEFRVLAHIARRQGKGKNNTPGSCFAKQKTIAETCQMSHRKAQDVLRVLCGAGLVERQERDGTTNLYRIAPPSKWQSPLLLPEIRKNWKFKDTSPVGESVGDVDLDDLDIDELDPFA